MQQNILFSITKAYELNQCVNVHRVHTEQWRPCKVFYFLHHAQIHAYHFHVILHIATVFLLLTSVTALFLCCHVRRKKYIPVRKCREAAAVVGTEPWKRVHDATSFCLPIVRSAQLFPFLSFSPRTANRFFSFSCAKFCPKQQLREELLIRNQPETQKIIACTASRKSLVWESGRNDKKSQLDSISALMLN